MSQTSLQMVNDRQLAEVLNDLPGAHHKRFAPDLNVLFLQAFRPVDQATISRSDLLEECGAWLSASPLSFFAIGPGSFTNRQPDPRVALCVLDSDFFERMRGELGDSVVVGVPAPTRILISRDTEKHRLALRLMLQKSPEVEAITTSLRLYGSTRTEAGWSPLFELP